MAFIIASDGDDSCRKEAEDCCSAVWDAGIC